MTLKEDFLSSIEKARKNERQKRRETLPDAEWWQEIRDSEIEPILVEAVGALNASGIAGAIEKKNGGSGTMIVVGDESYKSHLTFTHPTTGTIQITSSEIGLNELWDDRKHVIPKSIADKVRNFLKLVAVHYPEKEPSKIFYELTWGG
jgi:hypothetical protein